MNNIIGKVINLRSRKICIALVMLMLHVNFGLHFTEKKYMGVEYIGIIKKNILMMY